MALSRLERGAKRAFDIFGASVGLGLTWWIVLIGYVLAALETKNSGFYRQERVGYEGSIFKLIKLRTMNDGTGISTVITTANDPRITRIGRLLRKHKVDELPQLFNILIGDMSFVGPRPDVPGYADKLVGSDRLILSIRPGLTGPATLYYRHEEQLLAAQKDPDVYNNSIIWPKKVKINKAYVNDYSFKKDIRYILETIFGDSQASLKDDEY